MVTTYTSICGNFDKPRTDILCFTDSATDKFIEPVMNAKIYKVLSHKYLTSPATVYIDGNIYLNISAEKLVEEFLGDYDMALFCHPWRTCLYEEAKIVRGDCLKDEFKPLLDQQTKNYRLVGMPQNYGLAECGILIRKNNKATAEFNERWWSEICRYTHRDQISFPYVLWKMKGRIKVNFLEGNVRQHAFFKYVNHGK